MSSFKKYVILIFLMFMLVSLFPKTAKYDELRFQLGFGGFVSTSNLMGLIENAKMIDKIQGKNEDPELYGLTDEQRKAFGDISKGMQTAIVVANMLAGFEYGLKMRILWHMLISDVDFLILPFDGSYNGRFDMMLTDVWVLDTILIMPYITTGATLH